MGTGQCPHGIFDLEKGCPQCSAEFRSPKKELVKVRLFSETTGEISMKEYTYYTADPLEVGDIILVPVRDSKMKARISAVAVPEATVAAFKDAVKTIPAGSKLVPQIPVAKPGDEWKNMEPLDLDPGPYGVQEWPPPGGLAAGARAAGAEVTVTNVDYSHPAFSPDPNAWRTGEEEVRTEDPDEVVIMVAPGKDAAVQSLLNEVLRLKETSRSLVIASPDDIEAAANDLKIMSNLKKKIMEKQKEWAGPIDERLKAVKEAFSRILEPLAVADKTLRGRIDAFHSAERWRASAAAQAQAALREAERQEALAKGEAPPPTVQEPVQEARKMYRGDIANVSFSKTWKWKVVNEALVPREYMMVDSAKVLPDVRRGKDIPGIEAWQEESTRVS